MNEELNGYAATLVDETQMVMDEFQTPVMAFTSTILDKIEDLLDCKDITVEHCKIMDKAGKYLVRFMHTEKVRMVKFFTCSIRTIILVLMFK